MSAAMTDQIIEAMARAIMLETNCGEMWHGERVFCDDQRLEDRCDCDCRNFACASYEEGAPLIRAAALEEAVQLIDALPVPDDMTRITYQMGYADGQDVASEAIRALIQKERRDD